MPAAADLVRVHPTLFVWHDFDSSVKADLFSSAVLTSAGVYFVDPIPLETSQLQRLRSAGPSAGIIITNANHQRAAGRYAEKLSVPIFAGAGSFSDEIQVQLVEVVDGAKIGHDLEAISLDGAVAGEIALYHPPDGGTLIFGDALINFEPYGFAFLPRKYCANEKEMRTSLRKLLAYSAERMLFAHGTPILSGASARLRQLLAVEN
jgi:glyoxylase-like metal-dependent hydrolase (beta-lactamase superfamily II)